MLTSEGKNHIRRYMAGYVPAIGQALSFGIGNRAEVLGDEALHLEVARAELTLIEYDFAENQVVFKAQIPDEFVGKIYEIGLYSQNVDNNDFGSRLLTSFDSGTEGWIDPSDSSDSDFGTAATRVGADSLQLAPPASNTYTASLPEIQLDLSGYSASDSFTFAYAVADDDTNQITFRFLVDASNYYSFNMGVQTSGYKIVETLKSTATVTGSPNWNNIGELQVIVTAKSGGATSVEFDAIRVEDKDSDGLDFLLVARKVLVAPYTKIVGQPQDVEFALDISL